MDATSPQLQIIVHRINHTHTLLDLSGKGPSSYHASCSLIVITDNIHNSQRAKYSVKPNSFLFATDQQPYKPTAFRVVF